MQAPPSPASAAYSTPSRRSRAPTRACEDSLAEKGAWSQVASPNEGLVLSPLQRRQLFRDNSLSRWLRGVGALAVLIMFVFCMGPSVELHYIGRRRSLLQHPAAVGLSTGITGAGDAELRRLDSAGDDEPSDMIKEVMEDDRGDDDNSIAELHAMGLAASE